MRLQFILLFFLFLTFVYSQAQAVAAKWIGSSSYQCATFKIVNTKGTLSVKYQTAYSQDPQKMGLAFLSQIASSATTKLDVVLSVNSNNRTDGSIKYQILSGITFSQFSIRYLVISKSVNQISSNSRLDYFKLAGQCKNVSQGSGIRTCTAVGNFTAGTGQIIDLNHRNILLIWFNTFTISTSSGKGFQFQWSYKFLNKNQYAIYLQVLGNTIITQCQYFRLIYDQTSIQSNQTVYLDGGYLRSNGTYPPLSMNFLFKNVTSFMVGLSDIAFQDNIKLNWIFNVDTVQTTGAMAFKKMGLGYWNYRFRICDEGYLFFNETDSMCYNQCNHYYYENVTSQNCLKCYYACFNCTNSNDNSCTTCSTLDNRIFNTTTKKCDCIPKFYDNGVSKCAACHYSCETCNSSSYCITCPVGSGRVWNSGQCLCVSPNVDGGEIACQSCSQSIPGCLVCSSGYSCTSCNSALFFSLSNNLCVCTSGHASDGGQCKTCSQLIKGCVLCSSSTQCTSCNSAFFYRLDTTTKKCICNNGYYQNGLICSLCSSVIPGCSICSSATECINCNTANTFYLNGSSCSCPVGKFINSIPSIATCDLCSIIPNCLQCTSSNYCTLCDQFKSLISDTGICKCASGYYETSTGSGICLKCPPGCITCTSSSCGSCISPFVLGTMCNCPNTYFLDVDKCSLCSFAISGCKQCASSSVCTSCSADQFFNPTVINSICQCKQGFFLDGKLCKPCQSGCKKCSDTICTQCLLNFNLINDQCICTSPLVADKNGTSCVDCFENSFGCLTCSLDLGIFQCDTCQPGFLMIDDNCICENIDPSGACIACDNSTVTKCCEPGKYFDGTGCQPCAIGCTICANDGSCLQCGNDYYFDGINCQSCNIDGCLICSSSGCQLCDASKFMIAFSQGCACQQGYTYTSNGKCQACSIALIGCTQCSTSNIIYSQCFSCHNDFVLDKTLGICKCPTGKHSTGPLKCQGCPVIGCSICLNTVQCQTCDQTSNFQPLPPNSLECECKSGFYIDIPNKRCIKCQIGCSICQSDLICTSCDQTKGYTQNTLTTCKCMIGFYNNSGVCAACQIGCLSCNSITCNDCDASQHFELTSPNCSCISGYLFSNSVQACVYCNTSFDNCIECSQSICSKCDESLYQLISGNCQCLAGTYSNTITCVQCSSKFLGCKECDINSCIQCDFDKKFVQDSLLIGCQCAIGYLPSNGKCLNCAQLIYGCSTCSLQTVCDTCNTVNIFISDGNGNCQCMIGYFDTTQQKCQLCNLYIKGCTDCDNASICLTCDTLNNYILVDGSCSCIANYYFVNNGCYNCSTSCQCVGYYYIDSICQNICGDKVVVNQFQQCDDGNLIDGDGCSHQCKVQQDFKCQHIANYSSCSYAGILDIKLQSFQKDNYCNCLNFVFTISPNLSTTQYIDFADIIIPNLPIFNPEYTFKNGKLVITYQYNTTLQGQNLSFLFAPQNNANFTQTKSVVINNIPMILDSNQPIIVYDEDTYNKRKTLQKVYTALVVASYATFFLSMFTNKIVGLEMMGVLQLAFFVLADFDFLHPLIAPLRFLKYSNGFNLNIQQHNKDVPVSIRALDYNQSFFNDINVMLLLPLICLICSLVLFLIGILKPNTENKQKILMWSNNFLKQYLLTSVMFSLYNISFSTGLHTKYSYNLFPIDIISNAIALSYIIIVVSIFLFKKSDEFGQFKLKFMQDFMSRNYMVVSFVYRTLIGFLIAYENQNPTITIINSFLSIGFLMYIIINLPFKEGYHIYRSCLCQLSIITIFFVSMYYRSMKQNTSIQTKGQLFTAAYIQIGVICITIVISIIILCYEIFEYFYNFLNKQHQILAINQKDLHHQTSVQHFQINHDSFVSN